MYVLTALSNDLWTKMVQELLKFTLSAPSTAMSGLLLLSELLPLPLPLQTKEVLFLLAFLEKTKNKNSSTV